MTASLDKFVASRKIIYVTVKNVALIRKMATGGSKCAKADLQR
jgi:hypothetical protein